MAANPIHEVVTKQFKVLFMLGDKDDIASVENVDAEVVLPDGTRWSATFMSMREIERIMDRWRSSGENDDGAYFRCSDLVVIREGGVAAMIRALEHAIATGGPHAILSPLD